jgi:hypothetical protein
MDESKPQSQAARAAVVLRPKEQHCEVSFGVETAVVGYGIPFSPRARTLTPGHRVAVTDGPDAALLIIWRWYDAVVLEQGCRTGPALGTEPRRGACTAAQ